LLQMDVTLVLFDPGFDGTAGLPDVHSPGFAGHAVYTRSLDIRTRGQGG
jgi:hypothetical protein